jgi:hypothetical protein
MKKIPLLEDVNDLAIDDKINFHKDIIGSKADWKMSNDGWVKTKWTVIEISPKIVIEDDYGNQHYVFKNALKYVQKI